VYGLRNLKRIRVWRGFSLSELSEASGVPIPTITQQEGGKPKTTTLETADKLASALNVPLQILYMELPWDLDVAANTLKGGSRKRPAQGGKPRK
jgi:transcriptional regulator with XRE-family HTH domain